MLCDHEKYAPPTIKSRKGKKKTQKRKAIHARADAEMVTAGESI